MTVHVEYDALDDGRDRCRTLEAGLHESAAPVARHVSRLTTAMGQFAPDAADGLDTYGISWGSVLPACGEAAGIVAANVGAAVVTYSSADQGSRVVPDLAPRTGGAVPR
jgi:hypothetical protein